MPDLNFLSAFRHQWCLSISMSMVHVHVHAAHQRCVCVCDCMFVGVFMCVRVFVCVHVHVYKCQNAELSGIWSVRYRTEKTNVAGTGPVPDQVKAVRHFFGPVPGWNYWCQNADAGISFLDDDAQVWSPLQSAVYCIRRCCFLWWEMCATGTVAFVQSYALQTLLCPVFRTVCCVGSSVL
jgi:hypothetical protein